jgi:hypothetical protein
MSIELIPQTALEPSATLQRVLQAKRAYTTRRVPLSAMSQLLQGEDLAPCAGDLMLARVTRVGKHAHLESPVSRRTALFVGDEIVVACASRYAPDQFDARLPGSLGPCHLAAGGGVAATVVSRREGLSAPTELQPLGLLADDFGRRANLADHALPALACPAGRRPITLVSLGTSMNAGKTTSAAYLIRGLVRAGLRVGAAKVTGTGSGNDPGLLSDAGAQRVLDFTDAGLASTCQVETAQLVEATERIVAHLATTALDAIVLEVADGLFQRETRALLEDPVFARSIDGVLFSSNDAMGAYAGAAWLQERGLPPLALAGTVTRSPLARQEASDATGLELLGLTDLASAEVARSLWQRAAGARAHSVAA